jgi:hypothetical protein
LTALRQAEEISKTARNPTDKTDKTSPEGVLSVLSVPLPAVSAKIPGRQQGASASQAGLPDEPNGVCAEWRRGIGSLDANQPLSKVPAPWWRGLIRDAELFLCIWGKQAADLGWTTLDLFGAHPKAPAARFSCMGLLLVIGSGRVVAVTAESAVIERQSGAQLTYTRRPPEAECVPVWELPGGAIAISARRASGSRCARPAAEPDLHPSSWVPKACTPQI